MEQIRTWFFNRNAEARKAHKAVNVFVGASAGDAGDIAKQWNGTPGYKAKAVEREVRADGITAKVWVVVIRKKGE